MIDAVVTHHLNPFRSGVARFNALLAERLGVPLVGLASIDGVRAPLLSFKVSELGGAERGVLSVRLRAWRPSLFLHEWAIRRSSARWWRRRSACCAATRRWLRTCRISTRTRS